MSFASPPRNQPNIEEADESGKHPNQFAADDLNVGFHSCHGIQPAQWLKVEPAPTLERIQT